MTRPSRWMIAILFFTVVTAVLATVALLAAAPAFAAAEAAAVPVDPSVLRWGFTAAAASAGLAALGALAEKPDLFGRVLVMVGLAEGIAIYGLIVSILILNRLG